MNGNKVSHQYMNSSQISRTNYNSLSPSQTQLSDCSNPVTMVYSPVSELNVSCGVVSCEGESDKGETLSQESSTVSGRKVWEPVLLGCLKDIKVGGVIRTSDRGDVGRENWAEGGIEG